MGKPWKDYIPTYLLDCSTFLMSYDNRQVHALIVEGPSDEKFYHRLLNCTFTFLENGTKINFNTKEKNIISNFSNYYQNLLNKSEPYKFKQHKKDIETMDTSGYMSFRFVTTCISFFEKNKQLFKNINFYGIIDKDFGHDDLTNGLTNIASTKLHDRETCLIKCYMINVFDAIDSLYKGKALIDISKILDFTFKQGILEKASFKFEKNKSICLKNQRLFVHNFFKDEATRVDFRNFDFENYFSQNQNFNEIIEIYRKDLQDVYKFSSELETLIRNWLIDDNLSKSDEERLDRILSYSNGHILINQLIKCCSQYFTFISTKLDETKFVDYILAIMKNKPNKIYSALPLSKYKEYRILNNFYIKAS